MARRRMFSGEFINRDSFIEMPGDAQRLYFFLLLQADDDGFVGNPRGIADMWHIAPDCLRVLIAKRFVISFEAGCIVIRHWKLHNCISKRKYTPTVWQREFRQLVEVDGEYLLVNIEISREALPINEPEAPPEDFTGEIFNNSEEVGQPSIVQYSSDQESSEQVSAMQCSGAAHDNNATGAGRVPLLGDDDTRPPTLEELTAYCMARRAAGKLNYFDPAYFLEYNAARDWKDDRGRPIRWKMLVMMWENRGGERDKQRWEEQRQHERETREMNEYLSLVNRSREDD